MEGVDAADRELFDRLLTAERHLVVTFHTVIDTNGDKTDEWLVDYSDIADYPFLIEISQAKYKKELHEYINSNGS